jgi:hypothetical protein
MKATNFGAERHNWRQTVERDIPHLIAMLAAAAERLESYAAIPAPPQLEVRDTESENPS